MKKEIRTVPIELRVEGGDSPKIVGHAAVFNKWSEDLGGFREKIAPGAFTKTISEGDVRALFNHDPNYVLGRNKAGTLSLEEDKKGLKVSIDPPDTQWARDLTTSIERGDINQMSFGFRTVKDQWTTPKTGNENKRELLEVELFDVSPVTFPAYPQTDVGVRSIDLDEMNRVLLKADKDIPLSENDETIIRSNIAILEHLIVEEREEVEEEIEPVETPVEEPVTVDHSAAKSHMGRMRLQLTELKIQEDITNV